MSSEERELWERVPLPCPFCRSAAEAKEKWVTTQGERGGMRGSKRKLHYYVCSMCGAQAGAEGTEAEALLAWNWRPTREWVPLPVWGASYLLPSGQQFRHLLVHERGAVTLVDYVEEEISAEGDGVVASLSVDFGRFRLCAEHPKSHTSQEETPQAPQNGVAGQGKEEGGVELPEGVEEQIRALVAYALGQPNQLRRQGVQKVLAWLEE